MRWTCESSMKASLMHSPHWNFRACCTSTFSQPQPLLATFSDYTYIINVKNTRFKPFWKITLSNVSFIHVECWLISNITPPNFRLYTKPSYLKKHSTSLIIQMLSKNVQNFCIVSHSKILRAAPYFAHLSNFKVTTNTQIINKSQGSALAIFKFCLNKMKMNQK